MSKKSTLSRAMSIGSNTSSPPAAAPAPAAAPPARTAPGALFQQMGREAELRAQLAEFDGATPSRHLDPSRIRDSRFPNRHADSYEGQAFQDLVIEIAASGGNIQPILVRPVKGDPDHDYEVVFGHRRKRACQKNKLPVLAMIRTDLESDAQAFEFLDRENRNREDLRPYELGLNYQKAIQDKLFRSGRDLADRIGRSVGIVSMALQLAELPDTVVNAFPSPLDLQFRWAKPLHDAYQADANLVRQRLAQIKKEGSLTAAQIFERLTAPKTLPPAERVIPLPGGSSATLKRTGRGGLTISFSQVDDAIQERLEEAIKRVFG